MSKNVNITPSGIKKVLKNYDAKLAIAEFIWNGFDAKADTVHLNFEVNELGTVETIEVADNGYGINFEQLNTKFDLFYSSEKAIEVNSRDEKHISTIHGKNGIGRLTFFTFAQIAQWKTTFQKNRLLLDGEITVNTENINNYNASEVTKSQKDKTGTSVNFYNITISKEELEGDIIPFLKSEFCWFLELNRPKGFSIIINGTPLDYQSFIEDSESFTLTYEESNTSFYCKYYQWNNKPHKELSRFYYLNASHEEVYKDYTTLNNKGDEFYHSVYITSSFFNDFDFQSKENNQQTNLFSKVKYLSEYKFLHNSLNEFLRKKRKDILHKTSTKLIEKYEQDEIFPKYENDFDKSLLEETLVNLYEVQPRLFISLNVEQKKFFVRLLNLLLASDEREHILETLEGIIEMNAEEKESLYQLLQKSSYAQ
ncbi:ATP-binding protein [Arcicella aquatica]|uniref:ATP-binding protein n=1 Tax=Arcicella aquatica TaxID=217141 RepID=A0ABU5QKE0_9BACT|nr:ATP-binding protein [Arcicella aquatica]MEA5257533.1 ATP-binding protein [Arcicella aquatica]